MKLNASKIVIILLIVLFFAVNSLAYYTFPYPQNVAFNARFPHFYFYQLFEYSQHIHGLLFIIPIVLAVLAFGVFGGFAAWFLAVIAIAPRMISFHLKLEYIILNLFYLMVPVMIAALFWLEIKLRQQHRLQAAHREEERKAFLKEVLKAQEDERQRISRDLHDDTIQRLWISSYRLEEATTASNHAIDAELARELVTIKEELLSISEDVRRMSVNLRPSILDDIGLVPALRWYIENQNVHKTLDIKLVTDNDHEEPALSRQEEIHVYRIIQEVLNNIKRHAEAKHVMIAIRFIKGRCEIAITDDGKGFAVPKNISFFNDSSQIGLASIRQRTELLGGTLEIKSTFGEGTNVKIRIPLQVR